MLRLIKILAVTLVPVAGLSVPAVSAPITVPPVLNPGDQYRLAFVTSTSRDGTSSNIADYNSFVTTAANSQAALSALGTVWRAIVSTAAVDARDNTQTNPLNGAHASVPVYLLTGSIKIADNNIDLWDGSLDAPFDVSDAGNFVNLPRSIWTGSTISGTEFIGNTMGTSFPRGGTTAFSDNRWINNGILADSAQHRFYAISDVLTVPAASVNSPGVLLILGLGVGFMVVCQSKRRPGRFA